MKTLLVGFVRYIKKMLYWWWELPVYNLHSTHQLFSYLSQCLKDVLKRRNIKKTRPNFGPKGRKSGGTVSRKPVFDCFNRDALFQFLLFFCVQNNHVLLKTNSAQLTQIEIVELERISILNTMRWPQMCDESDFQGEHSSSYGQQGLIERERCWQ